MVLSFHTRIVLCGIILLLFIQVNNRRYIHYGLYNHHNYSPGATRPVGLPR